VREIFKFEDKDRKTVIRLVAEGSIYILVSECEGVVTIPVTDTDFDHVSSKYTMFLMRYVNDLKKDYSIF